MSVISISVVESSEQVVAGIPKTISITTNVPSTIFYTLNGTDPNLFSIIYTGPIFLPYDKLTITLKILASDGVSNSPILTEIYSTNILNDSRLPRSATDAGPGTNFTDLFPFGTNQNPPVVNYLNPGDAGTTVNDPTLPQISSGFDGSRNPDGYTNASFNSENYEIKYSTTDMIGRQGPGIGNLPADVKIIQETKPPEQTNQFSNMFDPRAMVIFQDASQEKPDDPVNINRQAFSLEDPNRTRQGNYYFSSALDAPPLSGGFIKSFFNPRDNSMTSYFFDSWSLKWIISKSPFVNTGNNGGLDLSGVVQNRQPGSRYVHQWIPFQRRVLF